jgi:hypothetical protein
MCIRIVRTVSAAAVAAVTLAVTRPSCRGGRGRQLTRAVIPVFQTRSPR